MPRALILILAALLTATGVARAQEPSQARHVRLDLVASTTTVAPGGGVWVAVRQRIERGWHTYWRNPGDSGQATQVRWTLPPGWRAGPISWPTPSRTLIGPLMNYGYADEVWLPVPLLAPANAREGPATLTAAVALLVCADVCVPEDATLTLTLPVSRAPLATSEDGPEVLRRLAAAPRPANVAATLPPGRAGSVRLALAGPALAGAEASSAWFYPFEGGVIDHAAAQRIERGASGLTLTLTPSSTTAPAPTSLSGVVALNDRAFEVIARPGPPPVGSGGLGPAIANGGDGGGLGLPLALGLALLGGLVLNLMPCVFPILALKAAQLARHAHDPRSARWQGLAYTSGVLATFAGLAGAVIALNAGGDAVGWGFQLQSPTVVGALALLMLLIALNLLGVFEVGASAQRAAGGPLPREGLAAAFLTGVLAVVVAAPCTAPFMAGAIGWALTQDAVSALAVFLALGLGLAAPFLLLSFVPRLLSWLPKPGRWMVWLQRALAIPMAAAAAWLLWLLWRQGGAPSLWVALAAAAAVAAAAAAVGWDQRRGGRRPILIGAVASTLALVVVWPVLANLNGIAAHAPRAMATSPLPFEAWSPERLAALRAQGRPVFVNFTADWCVTCQINDRLALADGHVREALQTTNAVYMIADWTRRDPAIAAELAARGRAGVPLYLVYPAGGGEPETLPQILGADAVAAALERAVRS